MSNAHQEPSCLFIVEYQFRMYYAKPKAIRSVSNQDITRSIGKKTIGNSGVAKHQLP